MEKENLNQHLPPIPRFAHRVLDAFYEHTPYFITSHHLQSYNDFIGRQLRVIIASMNEGFAMVDKGGVEKDGAVDPATLQSIHVWMGAMLRLRESTWTSPRWWIPAPARPATSSPTKPVFAA
jgi:hypothetical protein